MKADDRAAFDAFVRVHGPELLRFACALTGDRVRAEDLLQEALVRLGARWSKVATQGDPSGYARRVMANTRVSWWRRVRRETLVAAVPDLAHTPVDRDLFLLGVLAALPPRQRAVITLRYLADYSEAATAETLGCSTGTVKSQAAKGLAKLRALLPLDIHEELR
ncbi:MAG: SigE family RNA polymerase sigma factor [Mycobacteriales bacterium]